MGACPWLRRVETMGRLTATRQQRCIDAGKRSEVLLPYVFRSIVVCIELIATGATVKQGLRTTIVPVLEPTTRARLGRVSRVHLDHLDTACFGFVLEKRIQLCERPTMQASFAVHALVVLASSHHARL